MRTWLFARRQQPTHHETKRNTAHAQIGDVPRVDERLDDEPVIRRLPKIRPALPALRLPRLAPRHAPHKHVFDAAAPPQRLKLLRIVHRAAEPEPPPDRPVVLDVRPLVDRPQRVREQQPVVVLRRRRRGPRGEVRLEHVPHRVRQAARPREDEAVVCVCVCVCCRFRALGRRVLRRAHRRAPRARTGSKRHPCGGVRTLCSRALCEWDGLLPRHGMRGATEVLHRYARE